METEVLITCLILVVSLLTVFVPSIFADAVLSPDDSSSGCVLNFSSYPYRPTGECIGGEVNLEKISFWGSVPTNLCCGNALTTLSQALALLARDKNKNMFLQQDQWTKCSGPFETQPQSNCSFNDLYFSGTGCSTLSLNTFSSYPIYQTAINLCSTFEPSFADTCRNCSAAVISLRDDLVRANLTNNSTEKSICGVAAVVSIAATNIDNASWTDDFYRCLLSLDEKTPGYMKIKYSTMKLMFALVIAGTGMTLIIILIKYVTRRSKLEAPRRRQILSKESKSWSTLYRFSKSEIDNAINFWPEKKYLGRGSAGLVYKGILPSGQAVAIKHIYKGNLSDSFTREVEGLSKVRHQNLVSLYGFCVEDGEQYLVYEYCGGGNLSQQLLRKETVLTWERRVKILKDCANALRYLHHFIDGCIVHRDIKLTNILLTEDLQPKLSDFGLAKMLGMEESKVFTDVRGTIGYMDPEYMSNAKLTCASDIYSFGIVALQLLSGQKVIELDLDARDQLTRKAKDVMMGKRPLSDFEDPRLNGDLNRVDFQCILHVAVFCVAKASKDRPTIDTVFEEMEKAWHNTVSDMKAKLDMDPSAASMSRSLEVVPV